MTDRRQPPDSLAAEFALGVATDADARRAGERAAADPAFRDEVAEWRGRFAPLFDEIEPVTPPGALWERIERTTHATDRSNVLVLRRRVLGWQAATAGMTALAASLAIVLIGTPRVEAPAPSVATAPVVAAKVPMVAMLDAGQQTKIMASWDPMSKRLVLAVAGDMPSDPAHAHELWVIPPGGQPRSIGTMGSGKQMHMRLADALATLLQQGATIAITVEPPGGSPSGKPTGPMVASGALTRT